MPKKLAKRAWTQADDRMLKSLARKGTKTTAIARRLKRTLGATYQHGSQLGISLRNEWGSAPSQLGGDSCPELLRFGSPLQAWCFGQDRD
jgi:hypothetical protein